MTDLLPLDHEEIIRRIGRDLADSYDEELELEVEDPLPLPGLPSHLDRNDTTKEYRLHYFHQLFRLQSQLVKLQDWVVAQREKLVVGGAGRRQEACSSELH